MAIPDGDSEQLLSEEEGNIPIGLRRANTMKDYERWILRPLLPNGTTIVGFADDIAIVSVAKAVREIEEKTNRANRNVAPWLDEAGLPLVAHKTETVLISGEDGSNRCRHKDQIEKGNKTPGSDRLSYKKHVKYIGEKASLTQAALARMMPNIGEPGSFKRRLILAVVTSIMLYACPIWTTRKIMSSVYRLSAIRRISSFIMVLQI